MYIYNKVNKFLNIYVYVYMYNIYIIKKCYLVTLCVLIILYYHHLVVLSLGLSCCVIINL